MHECRTTTSVRLERDTRTQQGSASDQHVQKTLSRSLHHSLVTMLRTLASRTVSQLGLRTAVASTVVAPLAVRGFATGVSASTAAPSH